MKIVFAGGGTAGHINPALAVADYVKERHPDAQILYIGTAKKLEAKLVPEKGYEFHAINVAGFQRKLTPKISEEILRQSARCSPPHWHVKNC